MICKRLLLWWAALLTLLFASANASARVDVSPKTHVGGIDLAAATCIEASAAASAEEHQGKWRLATADTSDVPHATRGALELGGFAKGVSPSAISKINQQFGGATAINGSVESVLAQASRYEGFYNKAASVVRGIAGNHLFDNGNKRTAHAVLDLLKSQNGVTTGVSNGATRRIINQVATGELSSIPDIARALRGF